MNRLLLLMLIALFAPNAYAYLDPGTGSLVLQMLAAGLFGVLFTVKIYWKKVKGFFESKFSSGKK